MRIRNDSQLFYYIMRHYIHIHFSQLFYYIMRRYININFDLGILIHSTLNYHQNIQGGKKLDTSFMSLTHFETASDYLKSIPGHGQ